MNDFHATPVQWAEFCLAFETAGLASQLRQAKTDRDYESMISLSVDFLNPWLWEKSSTIEKSLPMTLEFYRLGAVTRAYQALQPHLHEPSRRGLDALLIPFIGQWLIPPVKSSLADLSSDMQLLASGGLSFALAPQRCSSIVSCMNSTTWSEDVKSTIGGIGIAALDDREVFSSMISELISLVSLAAQYHCGVIAAFEI
jgi:hypothetical protein